MDAERRAVAPYTNIHRKGKLQNQIYTFTESGNPVAEICWRTALDLLSEFGN